MGQNRVQKKENQRNKQTRYDNTHNTKHVRAKQAIIAKRNANTVPQHQDTKGKGPQSKKDNGSKTRNSSSSRKGHY